MIDRSHLPLGYEWYGPTGKPTPTPHVVFREGGGGCMANDPPSYVCSVWYPGAPYRAPGIIMGTGGSKVAAKDAALANAWELFDALSAAPQTRLRRLIEESVKRNNVYSSELPEILGLILERLPPEIEPAIAEPVPDGKWLSNDDWITIRNAIGCAADDVACNCDGQCTGGCTFAALKNAKKVLK